MKKIIDFLRSEWKTIVVLRGNRGFHCFILVVSLLIPLFL